MLESYFIWAGALVLLVRLIPGQRTISLSVDRLLSKFLTSQPTDTFPKPTVSIRNSLSVSNRLHMLVA
jgi:hypothetical protein